MNRKKTYARNLFTLASDKLFFLHEICFPFVKNCQILLVGLELNEYYIEADIRLNALVYLNVFLLELLLLVM